MTPKEKAKDLVDKFSPILLFYSTMYNVNKSKQCALIAVDEILLFLSLQIGFYDDKAVEYFKEVKQELEKL